MKLIGLSGISGSGKTHILRQLQKEIGVDVSVLSFDNYYKPIQFQKKDANGFENFDLPEGLDSEKFIADIERLKAGHTVRLKVYQFNNPDAEDVFIEIRPAPILLIEGIFILHFPGVLNRLDHKVFLTASPETTLKRRLSRDSKERGISDTIIQYQWNNHAIPGYEKYLLPYKNLADIVIENNEDDNKAVAMLSGFLIQVVSTFSGPETH